LRLVAEIVSLMQESAISVTLEEHIAEVRRVLAEISKPAVERVVAVILDAYRRGAHIYVLGNGGSASTASHFACDLSKATIVDSRPRLRVTSLTDNVALITAWANDGSFEAIFSEQLANVVNRHDVVLAISVSGNSPNVLAAIATARERGAVTVGFVGLSGGAVKGAVDVAVQVASDDYGVVEDCHLVLEHAITASTRRALAV
jgi:D-sedoheptulose 7-phosphate isomerase